MEKYSCSLPSFFRKVERKNMAAYYAKIRDGGKGAGLHYRTFEGFSKVVALKLRQLRREDFQIATRNPRSRVNSPLKKPPGEGTGPTIHADVRGNLVGRVPSRGGPDFF